MDVSPCYGEKYTTRKRIDELKKDRMDKELSSSGWGFVK